MRASLQGPISGLWDDAAVSCPAPRSASGPAAPASGRLGQLAPSQQQHFTAAPLFSGSGLDGALVLRYALSQQDTGNVGHHHTRSSKSYIERGSKQPFEHGSKHFDHGSKLFARDSRTSRAVNEHEATHVQRLVRDVGQVADVARYIASGLFDRSVGESAARTCAAALHGLGYAATLKDVFVLACAAAAELAAAVHCADMHAAMALVPSHTSSHALFMPLHALHQESLNTDAVARMSSQMSAFLGGSSAGNAVAHAGEGALLSSARRSAR